MIQDLEGVDIIKLPNLNINFTKKNDEKNIDEEFKDLIIENSYRKENVVYYNFDEIEEQLASNILSNINSFKSDIRTVSYQYENYISKRAGIITEFIKKYKQRKLTEKESNAIKDFIKNNKDFKIKDFLFSFQILIDFILDNNLDINQTIYSIIENNKNFNILNIFINIVEKTYTDIYSDNFKIDCLIDFMDIVECECWKDIRKNIDEKYLKNIDENIQKHINAHFEEEYFNKNNFKVTKIEFCSALRKYISRYLTGKNEENIKGNLDLKNNLINIELWLLNYDMKTIEEEINDIFKEIKVEISQAVKLFEYLEKNENDSHKIIEVNTEEEEEDDEGEEEIEQPQNIGYNVEEEKEKEEENEQPQNIGYDDEEEKEEEENEQPQNIGYDDEEDNDDYSNNENNNEENN